MPLSATPEPEPVTLLEPVSPPLEVCRGYARSEQTTLEIYKKICTLKEEASLITDNMGIPVVHVKGPAFWIGHFQSGSGSCWRGRVPDVPSCCHLKNLD